MNPKEKAQMKFLVIAQDGNDSEAKDRRLAARQQHLKLAKEMYEKGEAIIGGAILDDEGNMVGSCRILDFDSKFELEEWLRVEPYIVGKVWDRVQVHPFKISEIYNIDNKLKKTDGAV
jgi:uncharacterized protein YciI